jgi:hypothetical protein
MNLDKLGDDNASGQAANEPAAPEPVAAAPKTRSVSGKPSHTK